jgi:sensor histidine kinase regulating citrate/malate metabolism
MAVILGNLLDNAITAVCELTEDRYVNIIIKYDKGRFILKIDNPFEGKILKEKNTLLTTKVDKSNHGIGLQSIKAVLEKYNGSMELVHSKKVFSVTLLMYIELFESNSY